MGSLLLGGALWLGLWRHTGANGPTAALAPPAAGPEREVDSQPAAAAPEIDKLPPPPPASSAPSDAMPREQKLALADQAAAARIAAREQRLAALDWDAPRPGPPPADRRIPVSKNEAELTAQEKLDKTERIVDRLRDRVRRTQEQVNDAARKGQADESSAMLLARLQARVSELEKTAQSLRDESTGRTGPAGDPAPEGASPEGPR